VSGIVYQVIHVKATIRAQGDHEPVDFMGERMISSILVATDGSNHAEKAELSEQIRLLYPEVRIVFRHH
jgi:hypothetical protein